MECLFQGARAVSEFSMVCNQLADSYGETCRRTEGPSLPWAALTLRPLYSPCVLCFVAFSCVYYLVPGPVVVFFLGGCPCCTSQESASLGVLLSFVSTDGMYK